MRKYNCKRLIVMMIVVLATDVFPYLSRIEQSINDNGFTTRRAAEQDLKRMLGVYFEQNVTTEQYEDYDGDRWVIVGE